MKRRDIFAAVALAAALPLPANANDRDDKTTVTLTPEQLQQAKAGRPILLTHDQLNKPIAAVKPKEPPPVKPEEPPPSPYRLPTLSNYVFPPSSPSSYPCSAVEKALFVRSDPLDNFHYAIDPQTTQTTSTGGAAAGGNDSTKGLSVNYTDNMQANSQTATINGRVSYLLVGGQCSSPYLDRDIPFVRGVGFAPFVSSNGTWNEPMTAQTKGTTSAGKTITITTTKTSNNALRGGVDFQLELATGAFPVIRDHYVYVSPFYQTDYRGLAQISGVTLAWEPVSTALLLDYGPFNRYFMFFWQFRGEAEFMQVSNPGLTQFVKGQHSLVGEEARPHLELFPIVPVNPEDKWDDWFNAIIAGRISLIGTQKFYLDAATAKTAAYYSATLQYKLGDCKVDLKNPDLACSIQGSSSISLEYDCGRDKDTYVKSNQILVKLGYSY